MTRHPIAQIAPNGNLKLQEIRSCRCHFLQNQLFHRPRFASGLNGSAILHGRRNNAAGISLADSSPPSA
jgi:hypothetical protein